MSKKKKLEHEQELIVPEAQNSEYAIECDNLVKIYKTDKIEVVALQGLDMQIKKGELVAIVGSSGSGKSTLVKRLQEAFVGDDVVTLCHDYYYKAHPELTYEERTKLNYDHPQAFDTEMLVEHIKALKNNVPIEHPVYSFVEHDRMPETVCVKPSKVIIVDGILIFENKELRDLMDIKVYVDTDADIRLARRILRDVCERGRTMQSVITQYTSTVKPMHDEFVEPSKKYADVIIPEGGFNSVAVAMLIQSIRSLIERG